MTRHAIGPMILATAILAVPALATTSASDSTTTSPAVTSPAVTPHTTNMGAGMPADRTTTAADMNTDRTPKYMTADGQVRIGKIVGASVYNDQDQSIGSVDDVLMNHNNKATMAVLSVGGFLGMGSKLVSVPFDQLKIEGR